MLKEDYTINIIGKQRYEEEIGEVTLSTTGTYKERGNVRFIAYKEYDEDNPRLSFTAVLKVEPDKVTMSRAGSSTRLILEKGRRHLCLYDTGYGAMTVGVFTSEVKSALDKTGGVLEIKYTLDIDSNLSSSNELLVEVIPLPQHREQKGGCYENQ